MISLFPCIITGADLWDVSRNRWIHGDLFEGKDVWVFHGILNYTTNDPAWNYNSNPDGPDLVVTDPDYFERRAVIVVPKWAGGLTAEAEEYVKESRR